MITELTSEQESRFGEFVDRWLAVGLSTEPVDRLYAVSYGERLMQFLGRRYAATVVLDGPLHAWYAVCMVSQVRDQVRDQVGDQVRDQVWAQVGDQVWAQVGDQVGAQVRAQVGDQVGDQVRAQVWDQVGAQVWAQVWAQVGDQVRDLVWPYLDGQAWSGWCAFYNFFEEALAVNLTDWSIIADSTQFGPIWPLKEIVVVCDRPSVVQMQDGVLHCEDGPAWSYRDSTTGWSIGGVAVDEQTVMRPETQTVEKIRSEKNEEVKRIRIERFGWERFLREINASPVDFRINDIEGTYESLYRADGANVLAMVCPSTAKLFFKEMPTDIETCEQAQYWHSGGLSTRIISAS